MIHAASVAYPATPQSVSPAVLEPSKGFKWQAFKVLAAILFFVVVYIALVTTAVALAAACVGLAVAIVSISVSGLTIMLGLGLLGMGVLVVVFMVKFIFKKTTVDRSGLIEITEVEQPRLFEFVRKLTQETQTRFPKKIYLSHEVNAYVFYDSSFWSMFLPVRKNLHIGLGLVNCVTISEFKAILAHEFGHFSQRSMKLGSYVYNLNRIIYNLLYENDGYQKTLEGFADISSYFAIFALGNVKIIQGIQWVLQQVYGVINRQYMSLSREMEFHADTVAASVSGGNHLISSLRRLDTAGSSYDDVLSFYGKHIDDGLKPDNIFPQHREAMRSLATLHKLPIEHGLLQIDAHILSRFNKSRVVIKDQWASHPSTADRERHLRSLNIETPVQPESAWAVFNDVDALQKKTTEKLFSGVTYKAPIQIINEAAFAERYALSINQYRLPAAYKGFYDSRSIMFIDIDKLKELSIPAVTKLEDLLTDDLLALPTTIDGLLQDIQTLTAIQNGKLRAKNFEFNGQKYKAKDATVLLVQLNGELNQAQSALLNADQTIATWFLHQADAQGQRDALLDKYKTIAQNAQDGDADIKAYNDLAECIQRLHPQMPYQEVMTIMAMLKKHETVFKTRLTLVVNENHASKPTEAERQQANEYLAQDWEYAHQTITSQNNMNRLIESMYLLHELSERGGFNLRVDVLTTQLTLAGIPADH